MSPYPERVPWGRLISGLALAVVLGSAAHSAQEKQPVFRGGTDIVEVTVIVRDRDGRFVPDLTIDDFEVFEADEAQPVQTLYSVESPVAGSNPSRDLQATARPAARTFVFLFDMEHLSPGGLTRAREAVLQFSSNRLAPSDLAGVVAIGGTGQGRVSTDRKALVDSLKSLRPRGDAASARAELRQWPRVANEAEALQIANNDRAVLDYAVQRACNEAPGECQGPGLAGVLARLEAEIHLKSQAFVRQGRAAAQRTLATLDELARAVGNVPGRKTVVWISEGSFSDELREQARDAAYRASQAGVAIYALDPRGLARRTGGALNVTGVDEVGMDVLLGAAEDAADLLAVGSGGLAIRNENSLERALRTIEDDTSRYYVLGYVAPDTRGSGFRALRVRVRRPGLSVRARHGYMAPQRVATRRATAPGVSPAATTPTDSPETTTPTVEEPLPAATMTAGTIVAPLSVTRAAGHRLRPGVIQRVESLAAGDSSASSELAQRGWAAYQRGDVEAALPLLDEAAAEPQVRPWVLYTLGLSQMALGRAAEAAASWERVRLAAPEFSEIYIDLADTYAQLSNLTKALAVLREAERRWPANPEIHNAVGVIHVRRGALDDAIAAFAKAASAAPHEALAFFNLGRAYEMRFVRGQRYVSSQRRWTFHDEDRQKATDNYQRYLTMGGPYATQAAEAVNRLEWSKNRAR